MRVRRTGPYEPAMHQVYQYRLAGTNRLNDRNTSKREIDMPNKCRGLGKVDGKRVGKQRKERVQAYSDESGLLTSEMVRRGNRGIWGLKEVTNPHARHRETLKRALDASVSISTIFR